MLDNGTRFPNLALMKISGYYKEKGHKTSLLTSYYDIPKYDKVFVSKVFTKTKIPVNLNFFSNVEYGGTGFYYDKQDFLSNKIEHNYPDYSLYDKFVKKRLNEGQSRNKWRKYLDYSIGFATRFCFRQCEYCVNRNKKKVVKWSSIEEFLNQNKKKIILLDDNFLGYKKWEKILNKLIKINKPFKFEQGLDIRLLNQKKAKLLSKSKYEGDYIFAFDDYEERNKIVPKLKLWREYCKSSTKFYVLVAYKRLGVQDIIETFERIKILMKFGCLPYIMRYKDYEKSKYRGMYINLSRWCNQPNFYKKMSFREFCIYNKKYNDCTMRYLRKFKKENPKIADKYFDMKYENLCQYVH